MLIIISCAKVQGQSRARNSNRITFAADSPQLDVALKIRQQNVSVSSDSIAVYKRQKEFAYADRLDTLLKVSEPIKVDTFQPDNYRTAKSNETEAASMVLKRRHGGMPGSYLLRIIFWLLAAGFIVVLLYKLFFSSGLFRRDSKEIMYDNAEKEMLVNKAQFDILIQDAINKKAFRSATRFMFLQVLQNLHTNGAIQFTADKTNAEYERELHDKPYRDLFSGLIRHYEYVWYGRSAITEQSFYTLKHDFDQFNKNHKLG